MESASQTRVSDAGWTLPESLRQLASGGDPADVVDIIESFKTDSASRLRLLSDAVVRVDRSSIRKQAHALRGSAIQVGADALASLCLAIELESERDLGGKLALLLARAEMSFDNVRRAMDRMRL